MTGRFRGNAGAFAGPGCARVSVRRPASVPEAHHATHLSPAGTSGPAGVAARTGERGVLMALPGRTPRSHGGIASGGGHGSGLYADHPVLYRRQPLVRSAAVRVGSITARSGSLPCSG